MGFTLGEKALQNGYRLIAFDTIGSTNTEALERARRGEPGRLWVVAGEQTEGRGRRGRRWETPSGNMAATYLAVIGNEAARHAAMLGFVAGIALHETLSALVPEAEVGTALDNASSESGSGDLNRARFALKWPNDLLANGAKLSGILLESERLRGGELAVAIGIGVNVAVAPTGLPYKVTSLADLGCAATPEKAFMRLAEEWAKVEQIWNDGQGMAEIRRLWLERAAGLGGPVALNTDGRIVRGVFETIDETGRLVVRMADGAAETVAAAEVHFGTVAEIRAGG